VAIGQEACQGTEDDIYVNAAQDVGDGSDYLVKVIDASQVKIGMAIYNNGYGNGPDTYITAVDYGTNTLTVSTLPNNGPIYAGGQFLIEGKQGTNAIAIGAYAARYSQYANSIVINATGSELKSAGPGTLVVQSLRQVTGGSIPTGFYQVAWNPTTGEMIAITP
jgi:hypothetical protein